MTYVCQLYNRLAYWIAAVGVFKVTVLWLLLFELCVLATVITLTISNRYWPQRFELVFDQITTYVPVPTIRTLIVVLVASGLLLLAAILYGDPYLITLFSILSGACLVGVVVKI